MKDVYLTHLEITESFNIEERMNFLSHFEKGKTIFFILGRRIISFRSFWGCWWQLVLLGHAPLSAITSTFKGSVVSFHWNDVSAIVSNSGSKSISFELSFHRNDSDSLLASESSCFKKPVLLGRHCVHMFSVIFTAKRSGDTYFSELKLKV